MPVGALLSIGPTVVEGGGLFVWQTHNNNNTIILGILEYKKRS